ncbi:hypothetical protein BDV35DRAFT_362101 [Aspergillus flavus]|uniref:Secreted protein n=1 Tax=Aspergillus flavus TaxID=5059 RepID=A0A5N6GPB0_ASPFL|nr:hypothetical protein BDV35DRAFT_362101 [Aspergillus flavus]
MSRWSHGGVKWISMIFIRSVSAEFVVSAIHIVSLTPRCLKVFFFYFSYFFYPCRNNHYTTAYLQGVPINGG